MPYICHTNFNFMRRFLILLVLVFFTLDHYGQFTFGPKFGYTTSKLSTDFENVQESIKQNFLAGAFVRFGNRLYLQPEIFYSTSGGVIEPEGTDLKQEINLKNICVPALIGIQFINSKLIKVHVLAGPAANFIIGKQVIADELYQDPLLGSDFKSVSYGMDVGAGIDISIFSFDIKYEFGLNDIYNDPSDPDSYDINSNMFIISLGILLL